ncbi:hypothetical protein J6A31_08895 [bacterium]|nr:hypothetical protein [bacterium]
MNKYYFTYGSECETQPFNGGWTEIIASSREQACAMFRAIHPDKIDDMLNCAGVYEAEEFEKTSMYKDGNFGKKMHEHVAMYVFSNGSDRPRLNAIADLISDLLKNGNPTDEDLDFDDDAISVYHNLQKLKDSLDNMGIG